MACREMSAVGDKVGRNHEYCRGRGKRVKNSAKTQFHDALEGRVVWITITFCAGLGAYLRYFAGSVCDMYRLFRF